MDFAAGNSSDKNFMNLSLPQGSNDSAIVYLAKAFKKKRKFKKLRYKKKFEVLNYSVGFSDDFTLISPNKEGGGTTPIASYYKLVYLKNQTSPNPPGDFSPHPAHYMDFIFPYYNNPIPFQGTSGVVKYKSFDSCNYVNTLKVNGTNFISEPCFSEDDYNVTLVASPKCYLNGPKMRINPTTSLVGEELSGDGHFLDHLTAKLNTSVFARLEVTMDGSVDHLVIQQDRSDEFSDSVFNENDPEFLSILIEKSTYLSLNDQIVASSLVPKYGVWIYIDNILHTEDESGKPITELIIGLSGIEHMGSTVSRKKLSTVIKIYANDHI